MTKIVKTAKTVKTVVLRAPLLSQSGYGVHARQIAEFLLKMHDERADIDVSFDIVPWGITPWYVDPEACNGLIGKILQKSAKKEAYDVSMQLQLPNEWNPFLAKVNIGISAVVETDRCNPQWIESVNRMDMVIVPSEFTKSVLEKSGDVKVPINVVPESWVPEIKEGLKKKVNPIEDRFKLETDFNFLLVSQFTGNNPDNDRKNIAYTIKWFMEQFKDNTDVGLIIKTNFGERNVRDGCEFEVRDRTEGGVKGAEARAVDGNAFRFNVHDRALANDARCDKDVPNEGRCGEYHAVVDWLLGDPDTAKSMHATDVNSFAAETLGAQGWIIQFEVKFHLEVDEEEVWRPTVTPNGTCR